MDCKKETRIFIEDTNGERNQIFNEGDYIICQTEDGKRHIGRIVLIGRYQENGEAESESAICLDTSKRGMGYSREIIKATDIKFIYKNAEDDLLDYSQISEEQDQSRFINMIVELGHDKEKAKIMYDGMSGLMALYNIPISSILYNVIQEVELNADGKCQKELIEISNKLMGALAQAFETITRSIRKNVDDFIVAHDGEK